MKIKISKLLNNKRARYFVVISVLVLFCLVLNIAFSAFTHTATGVAANLSLRDMTYNVTIDSKAGAIVKVSANTVLKLNTTFTATNNIKSNYELSYDVCSDASCSSTLTKPSTLTVQYSSRTTDSFKGQIDATGTKKIRVVITNNGSELYIRLRMNSGYYYNTLQLEKKITSVYNEDDLTVYAYVNGAEVDSFPTTSDYSASVFCHKDGSTTAANATGTATYSNGQWVVNISGVDAGRTVCDVKFEFAVELAYTGAETTYIIPNTGTYRITVTGAAGRQGNKYGNTSTTVAAGKGASIRGDFNLNAGDILYINIGGMGSTTSGTANDGASGAGGGGTFVFKKVSSVTNNNIQFTKNSNYYEVLLVAAGGGGTGDLGYTSSKTYAGYDGVGATYYSSSNYTAFSQMSTPGTSSSATNGVMGITQYIKYNLKGGTYTRGSSVCKGGFGGGGCQDDQRSYGGGWSGSNYTAYSFCNGKNCSGINGTSPTNGIFKMIRVS